MNLHLPLFIFGRSLPAPVCMLHYAMYMCVFAAAIKASAIMPHHEVTNKQQQQQNRRMRAGCAAVRCRGGIMTGNKWASRL